MNLNLARVSRPTPAEKPLGIVHGRPVYRIMGAEEATDPQSGDADADDTGQSASDDDGKDSDGQSAKSEETVSRSEYEKLKERLSAADKARAEAERERKKLEQKDLDELGKEKVKSEELEQSVQTLTSELSKLRLENAFLRDSTFTWHDPSDVLRFVTDGDAVTIDENGKVRGMEDALKELAKKKPYLVKADKPEPKGSTGDPSNGVKTKTGKFDEAALRRKYKIPGTSR